MVWQVGVGGERRKEGKELVGEVLCKCDGCCSMCFDVRKKSEFGLELEGRAVVWECFVVVRGM